ncbi:hypothetical protein M885DRAFT_511373 [Pelagophyceae sp. CCMP2097]|nr:hypothetical protein M885DRAFT_511373 [Pelagophyceae sp. CCMP2097]
MRFHGVVACLAGVAALQPQPRSRHARQVSAKVSTSEVDVEVTFEDEDDEACLLSSLDGELLACEPTKPPFRKVMAANRAEIAVRIMRAATEMNMASVGIYAYEDRFSAHRWPADQSFLLPPKATPVKAYLDIPAIIAIAKREGVDAIHPGYGFLSESPDLAKACLENGITFVGPTVENLLAFSDKTCARKLAIEAGVSVVPGTDGPVASADEAVKFAEEHGLPLIVKASMGGGGKGMRVVRKLEDVRAAFESASSEAKASFGDGSCFIERYVSNPRHIEVQVVGDGVDVVHLWERDCSVQRRHQKVIEIAPAWNLAPETRLAVQRDAVKLAKLAKYKNAGTVEFLVDEEGRHYFIEVNPRIQVEHTVTEEVTSIDLVQTQFKIAGGATLNELGLTQDKIRTRGVAVQCRITTENPERDFAPDTGVLAVYRHAQGFGIRIDGIGYSGMTVTPFFDSLLVKYTARASTWQGAVSRMRRALLEMRVRGVKTNIPFLLNVLEHPDFIAGKITTSFIEQNPQLLRVADSAWAVAHHQSSQHKVFRIERNLRFLANVAVNGHAAELGLDETKVHLVRDKAVPPPVLPGDFTATPSTWRAILKTQGPKAFAKAVRDHKTLLVTDTTWRDAHQSLLATRVRTTDIAASAVATEQTLGNAAFSVEMWGGATFDVCMRFLHECPWRRLETLRALAPDVPFQMLLRGANAVGYTSYADNVVFAFCEQAVKSGIDIFRVFDSLNYPENVKLGIEAGAAAGGFVEAALAYTGDVCNLSPENKYSLDYYLKLAQIFVDYGAHGLAIKDMAGLLTPKAATLLVSALRHKFPDVPIHVHTHDSAGAGVASMLAAAAAGADVVDAAIDSMAGLTSQPSLGAIVAAVKGTELDTGLDAAALAEISRYWDDVRTGLYAPFESGQLATSSDVLLHEIPGGQYTNLLFQSKQLGLDGRFGEVKKAYAMANKVLGDIPKVTPSSKVVGDLAQFFVANAISSPEHAVLATNTAKYPDSVVEYLQGKLGVPPGGFPEPLRTAVLAQRSLEPMEGRPGALLPHYDLEKAFADIKQRFPLAELRSPHDALSFALYPKVFADWQEYKVVYGDLELVPTHVFLRPMRVGEERVLADGHGRDFYVRLASVADPDASGSRQVVFSVNGESWYFRVTDEAAFSDTSGGKKIARREKATDRLKHVGAPMPGVVVDVRVKEGNVVKKGEVLFVLSAMKMESTITAPEDGCVKRLLVNSGDSVEGDDLLADIEPV